MGISEIGLSKIQLLFANIYINYVYFLPIYLLFFGLERLYPAEQGQTWIGAVRNVLYTFIFILIGMTILQFCQSYIDIQGHGSYLPDLVKIKNKDDIVFILIATLIYLFAFDFIYYWYHRCQHQFDVLWAIHEMHHSDTELNVTTSHRTHFLEITLQFLLIRLPLILLIGSLLITPTVAILAAYVSMSFLYFGHANLRLQLGILSPIIVGPQVHRIHHSRFLKHQNKNFAQIFSIIDVMFGTYCAPQRDEFPPTGTQSLASDASIINTELRPFRYWKKRLMQLFKA